MNVMKETTTNSNAIAITSKFKLESVEKGFGVGTCKDEPYFTFFVNDDAFTQIEKVVNEPNTSYKLKADCINSVLKRFSRKNADCISKEYRHSLQRSIIKEWGGHHGFINKELRRIFL